MYLSDPRWAWNASETTATGVGFKNLSAPLPASKLGCQRTLWSCTTGARPIIWRGGEGLRSRGRAARPPGSGQWEPVVPGAGEAGELGFYSRTANHHQLGSLKQHTSSLRFCGLSGSALSSVQGLAKLQSRCQRNGVFSRMLEWGRVCIWASSGCHRLYFFTTVYLRPDFLLAVGQRPPSGRGGGFLNVAAHSVKPVREPTSVCW